MSADPPTERAGGKARVLRRLLIAVVVAVVAAELAMRLLLFTDLPGTRRVALRLRAPQHFFSPLEPGYWTTSVRFTPKDRLKPVPAYDPRVGWLGSIEPGTYAHPREDLVLTRRPVLLYGDSFAQCTTGERACWEGLLQASELGATHALLNYGVGGYGLDQAVLLLRASIDRFADRDPIVVLSIFVDDDLARMLLPFRGWPKPRFRLADGRLIDPEPVPDGALAFAEDHAPFVPSWTWRWLIHGPEVLPAALGFDEAAAEREMRDLARALIRSVRQDLEARGVTWFVLLFQGESVLDPSARAAVWQHDFLVELCREEGVACVSARRAQIEFLATTQTDPRELFERSGPARGHYTALGNQAAFPALVRGIRGEFD